MINPDEYQKDCVKLENKDFETIKARLSETVITYLYILLRDQARLSRQIDAAKKHIFYGKPMTVVDPEPLVGGEMSSGVEQAKFELINDNAVRKLHSILGLCTESGELVEMLNKHIFNGQQSAALDWTKEYGDVAWYLAQGSDTIPSPLSEIMRMNIEKLRKRYPERFEETLAQKHDGK